MNERERYAPPRMIQNVFVLLLLAVFAGLGTLLVTMGAQVYRDTVDSSDAHATSRVLNAIVRTAIWTEDGNGEIIVEDYDDLGIKCLAIVNDYDGDIYYKRLYCKDGWLYESFTAKEREFDGEMGESMCEATKFEPVVEDNLLKIEVADAAGNESNIMIAMRAGGAAK